jgi:hypothetical protein
MSIQIQYNLDQHPAAFYILLPTHHFVKMKALYSHHSKNCCSSKKCVFSVMYISVLHSQSGASGSVPGDFTWDLWLVKWVFSKFVWCSSATHHPTVVLYTFVSSLWGVPYPWGGTTLSHPWHLGWGLCLWPGTRLVKLVDWSLVDVVVFETSCPCPSELASKSHSWEVRPEMNARLQVLIECVSCFRMQGKRHVTRAWCRQPATWNPLVGYRCARGGHSGATLPRSTPCTGVQIQGKEEAGCELGWLPICAWPVITFLRMQPVVWFIWLVACLPHVHCCRLQGLSALFDSTVFPKVVGVVINEVSCICASNIALICSVKIMQSYVFGTVVTEECHKLSVFQAIGRIMF